MIPIIENSAFCFFFKTLHSEHFPWVSPVALESGLIPLSWRKLLWNVSLLDELVHGVWGAALSGAVVLEQTWVLFIQGLLSPGTRRVTMSACWLLLICKQFLGSFLPLQLFLFKLQLQHNSAQLHVEIVSSLQFPLVVLTNIQSMPETTTCRQ